MVLRSAERKGELQGEGKIKNDKEGHPEEETSVSEGDRKLDKVTGEQSSEGILKHVLMEVRELGKEVKEEISQMQLIEEGTLAGSEKVRQLREELK